jgi:hypothetical protein
MIVHYELYESKDILLCSWCDNYNKLTNISSVVLVDTGYDLTVLDKAMKIL